MEHKMRTIAQFITLSDLSGYTLIIPSVSVGNVPQLTVDLLITTFNFEKSATIWHPAIVPSVGSNPYYSSCTDLCTACELYINKEYKLATLQIRSTIDHRMTSKFFLDLKDTLDHLRIENIIILSSMFDYELHLVTKNKFYYLRNDNNDKQLMQFNNIELLEEDIKGRYCLNGSGFAVKLYETLSNNFVCTLLGKYVSEGDNRPDACMLLEKLVCVLKLNPSTEFLIPSSWHFVYGGPPPSEIY